MLLSGISVLLGKVMAPIGKVTEYAAHVAGGDLDAVPLVARSENEVGTLIKALQTMVRNLKDRIKEAETVSVEAREQARQAQEAKAAAEAAGEEVRQEHAAMLSVAQRLEGAVKVIHDSSGGLKDSIAQAENDAGRQAEYLAASASAMEEMSVTARSVSTNAENAKDFSVQTRTEASEGEKVVESVIGSIRAAQQHSLLLKDDMAELGTHAKSISQIMTVISDIADQTNLLALNAAIEAARAGEAGRGFAVVADEVRKLAEKTMASTGDVSQAVKSIHKSMDISMAEMGVTVTNIEQATGLATQSGEALRKIVSMADDAAKQVEGIVSACEQQAVANEHLSRSIAEVNAIAGKTHETMRGTSRDIAEVAGQADSINSLVAEMRRN
jgi:methyl-accepting chemotaxis protein